MHRTSRVFVSLAAVALASMLLAGALTPMQAFAGEQHKPRPVWRGWSARTHDDKQAEYIRFLDKIHHEELKAWKAAGLQIGRASCREEGRWTGDWSSDVCSSDL